MAALANHRHERFAQELAKGKSASEAYVAAGYAESRSAACRLATNVNVQSRAAELKERGAIKAEVTVATLLAEAEAARILAMSIDQPSAAIAAVKEKGILAGVRIEKSERKNTSDVRSLTDDELDAAIADALAREEAAARGSALTH